MNGLDQTHDPALRSWVESANDGATDFPIQNLPFGVFRRAGESAPPRVGVAIGDHILDVMAADRAGLIHSDAAIPAAACTHPRLNELMELGPQAARVLRRAVSALLAIDAVDLVGKSPLRPRIVVPIADAELFLPAAIGDYTDFYASIYHATNIGRMLRPDTPLLPNYKYVPIGYHGRASSIVRSGTDIRRPAGQVRDDPNAPPVFVPTRRLDYELELGALIGRGNALGQPIAIDDAQRHIFGCCLVNDWSARDVQAWEYQPLGPFLGKSFATTISPWVVTLDALEPYRARAFPRPAEDPAPLPYLQSLEETERGGMEITLEVSISSARMRRDNRPPFVVSRGNFVDMYWTLGQLVAHHTSNGCNLRSGDLLASGTISGSAPESRGSLMERTWRGSEPLALPGGEQRAFLEDDDEIIIRGFCERPGAVRIGFGECRGRVRAAESRPIP